MFYSPLRYPGGKGAINGITDQTNWALWRYIY